MNEDRIDLYVRWLVIAFILFFACRSVCADTIFEYGPAQISNDMNTGHIVTITERVADKYDFTLGWISEQHFNECGRPDCEWRLRQQAMFGIERVFGSGKLRASFGPYFFQRPDRVSPTFLRIGLSIEYRISEHIGLRARHWSNAGTADIACFRHSFDPEDEYLFGYKTCNDWNTGQDSWLRLMVFF